MKAGHSADQAPDGVPEAPSLQVAGLAFLARVLGLAGSRVELAGVELAETRERLVTSLVLVAAAFACATLAMLVATLGVVAWFWDSYRYAAIVVMALAYAGAALALWRRHIHLRDTAPALLAATAEALRRDAHCLRAGFDETDE